jgi:hypothetical protein
VSATLGENNARLAALHTFARFLIAENRDRPEIPMYLDAILADEPLAGGLEPRLGAPRIHGELLKLGIEVSHRQTAKACWETALPDSKQCAMSRARRGRHR